MPPRACWPYRQSGVSGSAGRVGKSTAGYGHLEPRPARRFDVKGGGFASPRPGETERKAVPADFDVVIVGAGAAGLSLAYDLCAQGSAVPLSVALVDAPRGL